MKTKERGILDDVELPLVDFEGGFMKFNLAPKITISDIEQSRFPNKQTCMDWYYEGAKPKFIHAQPDTSEYIL